MNRFRGEPLYDRGAGYFRGRRKTTLQQRFLRMSGQRSRRGRFHIKAAFRFSAFRGNFRRSFGACYVIDPIEEPRDL
jgi:hypothetical protein